MLAGVSGQAAPLPLGALQSPSGSAPLACVAAHSSHCGRMDARARLAEDGHLRVNGASLCKYGGRGGRGPQAGSRRHWRRWLGLW